MAFIPVNFEPLGNPVAEGLNNIYAARRQQRLDEQKRAEMLMAQQNVAADNARADREMMLQEKSFERTGKNQEGEDQRKQAEDFAKINEMAAHNPKAAREYAKALGYTLPDEAPSDALLPMGGEQSPAPSSPAAAPAPGGPAPSDTGPAQQFAPWAGQRINQPGASPTQPPAVDAISGPGPVAPPPDQSASAEAAPPPSANPIINAFMLSKGGRSFNVDPDAERAAQEERFQRELKLKSAMPEARIAATSLENEKKRQFLLDHPELKSEPLTFAEREKLANIAGGYRVKAANASQENPLKQDAAARQDLRTLSTDFTRFVNEHQLLIDSKTNKRLQTATANLNSGNAMQQREAAESLVSIFKGGGQVTKASQDLLLKHLSGIVGDAQTFIQHMETGHYGAKELAVLQQASQGALDEQNQRMEQAQQDAATTFGPGTGYENLAPNVNHKVRGFFGQFGMQAPDVYPETQAPPVQLGGAEAARKAGKQPNKIQTSSKASKLSPEDKQAVDWAKAHKGDPRAEQILRMHGM